MGRWIGVEVEYAWIKSANVVFNVPNEPPGEQGYRHLLRLVVECQDAGRNPVSVPIPTTRTLVLWETEKMISMKEWLDFIGSEEGRVAYQGAVASVKEEFSGYEG